MPTAGSIAAMRRLGSCSVRPPSRSCISRSSSSASQRPQGMQDTASWCAAEAPPAGAGSCAAALSTVATSA